MAIDFNDRNRYRARSQWNRFCAFVSKMVVRIITIGLLIIVLIFALPWLKILWETITGPSF